MRDTKDDDKTLLGAALLVFRPLLSYEGGRVPGVRCCRCCSPKCEVVTYDAVEDDSSVTRIPARDVTQRNDGDAPLR